MLVVALRPRVLDAVVLGPTGADWDPAMAVTLGHTLSLGSSWQLQAASAASTVDTNAFALLPLGSVPSSDTKVFGDIFFPSFTT